MTLILNCVTPDIVLQASDRRLTWLRGPNKGTVADDESNKAILIDGRVAFGYTGLAEVNSERTDRWLLRTVADGPTRNMAAVLNRIRDRASEAFDQIHASRADKRHAFLGAGWISEKGALVPASLIVTNAIRDGEWLERAEPEFWNSFEIHLEFRSGVVLRGAGQDISQEDQRLVYRFLGRLAKRGAPLGAYTQGLIVAMRWLAKRYPKIGPGLLVQSIPRAAVERIARTGAMMALLGPAMEEHPTFLSVPSSGESAELYGPHIILGGRAAMDIRAGPLPPGVS